MKNLAMITARGGSKRIPRKNIKLFNGKPIIAYAIEAALKSGLFLEVMVSTDDAEIAEVAKKHGALVPFMRSERNSNDYATTVDVINEVLDTYAGLGKVFDSYCCIYPTSAFVTDKKLQAAFELLQSPDTDVVFPVVAYSFPIQRSVNMDKNNFIKMNYPENMMVRSQDLQAMYHDSGQFYFVKTEPFKRTGKILGEKTKGIIVSELEVQDIDNETDWKLAEIKFQMMHAKN